MKRNPLFAKITWPLAAILTILAALAGFSQDANKPWDPNVSPLPSPTGFVNDFAGVIDQATKDRLEKRLKDFRDQTNPSLELAVAVVRTTGDRPIFDYSLAVARGWKIGSKADDNPSALLFVAIDDRKYFTQVSRDLEDELPDGVVGSLQRQYLVPEFKQGNYGKGIEDTLNAYITTIENKGNAPVKPQTTPQRPTVTTRGIGNAGGMSFGGCCILIFIVVVVLLIILGNGRGGGGGGGVLGGALPWIVASAVSSATSRGGSSWGGGGSSWGGSSSGGGGDFGGGGSGGDW